MTEVEDHFVTHRFNIDKYYIWGVKAFELIIIPTLVFQQLPQFPFFRHGEQLQNHFQMCVGYKKK